jgi:hypothetical protein
MAVNFSDELYLPNFNAFARPMTVTPVVSQPGAPAYDARCYFDSKETDILTEANSVLSDSQTFIDIRRVEFSIEPKQGDRIDIPFHAGTEGGSYEVLDLAGKGNAGGIITISLRAIETPLP